jgi:hypothetical protein
VITKVRSIKKKEIKYLFILIFTGINRQRKNTHEIAKSRILVGRSLIKIRL